MIPVLGYWALGDICIYSIVIGRYFFAVTPNMILDSRWCHPHDNHYICGAVVASRRQQGEWGGIECKLYSGQRM